ncbi:MAG: pyridoxal-phosphate dependent enzyme, partial [Flavobacteriaceae bacterium]|nr:pyridoxal-phosphate dependent enzyme [Flavobacteriaceae bacterium]
MKIITPEILELTEIRKAAVTLKNVAEVTPLIKSFTYSNLFGAQVLLKREDLQQVRSYKIRGAYNKISSLTKAESARGIVCASAGNHAQGVAYSCNKLKIYGTIFMPSPTPKQKIEQVQMFGGDYITIELIGDTFDDAQKAANQACEKQSKVFVHPFNDQKIIEGQATVGLEILKQTEQPI